MTDEQARTKPPMTAFGRGLAYGVVLGALLGVYVIAPYIQPQTAANKSTWQIVYVAYSAIPPLTRIDRGMIEAKKWPRDLITKNMVTRVQDVEGWTSKVLIRAGEPVHQEEIYRP